jgi:hypothetical protein
MRYKMHTAALALALALLGSPSLWALGGAMAAADVDVQTGNPPTLVDANNGTPVTRTHLRALREEVRNAGHLGGPGNGPFSDNVNGVDVYFDWYPITRNGENGIIVICAADDGNPGEDAEAYADGDDCAVYAIAGHGDNGSTGDVDGGAATAQASADNSHAYAWGGNAQEEGAGGNASATGSTITTDGFSFARGGDTFGGTGGWALTTGFGDCRSEGGDSLHTGSPGTGGDATAVSQGADAFAIGGHGGDQGGSADADAALGDAEAIGGASSDGAGGDAMATSGVGVATATGGDGYTTGGDAEAYAELAATATGGDGETVSGGASHAESDTDAATAKGGHGLSSDAHGGDARAISGGGFLGGPNLAFATGGDSDGNGTPGRAWATGPNGDSLNWVNGTGNIGAHEEF